MNFERLVKIKTLIELFRLSLTLFFRLRKQVRSTARPTRRTPALSALESLDERRMGMMLAGVLTLDIA